MHFLVLFKVFFVRQFCAAYLALGFSQWQSIDYLTDKAVMLAGLETGQYLI